MPARRERGQRRRQIGESSVFTQHPCGLRRAQHEPGVCRGDERDRVEAPYRGDEAVGFDEDGDDGRRNEGQRPSVSSSIRSGEAVNGRPPAPDRCGPRKRHAVQQGADGGTENTHENAGEGVFALNNTGCEKTQTENRDDETGDAAHSQVRPGVPAEEQCRADHEGETPVQGAVDGGQPEQIVLAQTPDIEQHEHDGKASDALGGRRETRAPHAGCDHEGRHGQQCDDNRAKPQSGDDPCEGEWHWSK